MNFLVSLDIEETKTRLKNTLVNLLPDINLDDVQKDIFINAFLYILSLEVDKMNFKVAQTFIQTATGEGLDALCANLGIQRIRNQGSSAIATVLSTKEGKIPKGFKFYSPSGEIATTLDEVFIKKGVNTFTLISTKEGNLDTIYPEYALEVLSNKLSLSPFELIGYVESDEDLRTRYKNSILRFNTAGSERAYEYFAKSQGAQKVKVANKSAGVVSITYQGSLEPNELAAALKPLSPITDTIEAQRATESPQDLRVTLTTREIGKTALEGAITKKLEEIFEELEIGVGVRQNRLIAACFIDGVIDAEITAPSQPGESELLMLGEVTFTYTQ